MYLRVIDTCSLHNSTIGICLELQRGQVSIKKNEMKSNMDRGNRGH